MRLFSCFKLKADSFILYGISQQLPCPYQYWPLESSHSAREWQFLKTKRCYCHASNDPVNKVQNDFGLHFEGWVGTDKQNFLLVSWRGEVWVWEFFCLLYFLLNLAMLGKKYSALTLHRTTLICARECCVLWSVHL